MLESCVEGSAKGSNHWTAPAARAPVGEIGAGSLQEFWRLGGLQMTEGATPFSAVNGCARNALACLRAGWLPLTVAQRRGPRVTGKKNRSS
jgi:hypothetical protein